MKFNVLLLTALITVTGCDKIAPYPVYGERLEGFEYPHPIKEYKFTSQKQKISMNYMDVEPQTKSNGKVVVLLHGKNFCGATWEKTIHTLSHNGYRVIAPDQVGFCKSSKPKGYQFSLSGLADNTYNLLKNEGIQKATIVGHSMGGMIATRFALMHPEITEKLILVNLIGLEDWQAKGVPYANINTLYKKELNKSYEGIKSYQSKYYYNNEWKPEYDKWVEMHYGMYLGSGKDIVAYNQAQTSEMIFTQPIAHEFKNLKVPTVLIIGQLDRTAPGANRANKMLSKELGNYPTLGKKVSNEIPNSLLIEYEELGHSPQVQAPDVFHKSLLKLLK